MQDAGGEAAARFADQRGQAAVLGLVHQGRHQAPHAALGPVDGHLDHADPSRSRAMRSARVLS